MTDILGNPLNMQYELLLPEIILAITALAVVFVDAFKREFNVGYRALPLLSLLGLAGAVELGGEGGLAVGGEEAGN